MDNKLKEENISNDIVSEENVASNSENLSENTASEKSVSLNTENVSESIAPEGNEIQKESNDVKSEKKSESKESLESILRRFKRQSSGIVAEIKKREAYDKPSVKRKKKSKEARRKRAGKFGYNKW